jgi:hypothetical protein
VTTPVIVDALGGNTRTARARAGRPLDQLVAEVVMGWTAVRSAHAPQWWRGPDVYVHATTQKPAGFAYSAWCPSTHMHYAWQVAKELRRHGLTVRIEGDDVDGWQCFVWRDPEDNPVGYGRSKANAPLALCRAALAAVTPEDDE